MYVVVGGRVYVVVDVFLSGVEKTVHVWPLMGSTFGMICSKLDKYYKCRCTVSFQAKDGYDVRLANDRFPGV